MIVTRGKTQKKCTEDYKKTLEDLDERTKRIKHIRRVLKKTEFCVEWLHYDPAPVLLGYRSGNGDVYIVTSTEIELIVDTFWDDLHSLSVFKLHKEHVSDLGSDEHHKVSFQFLIDSHRRFVEHKGKTYERLTPTRLRDALSKQRTDFRVYKVSK